MTGFTFTKRVGKARNLSAAEVDANFQSASDAVAAISVGAGTTTFSGLTDAATASIATVNTSVAAALAAKAPTASPNFTGTPTGITKTHVGLGNVDNTPDALKPVSVAQAAADALKAPIANPTFTGTVGGITATMVGLANVNNTADLSKPVSTATSAALALKQAVLTPGTGITIDGTNTISAVSSSSAVQVAYALAVPLDTAGSGKFMTAHNMIASQTFTVGTGPVEQGNCNFALVGGGGSFTIDTTAFTAGNTYAYDDTVGVNNIYTAIYTYGTPLLFGVKGAAVAVLPGQVTGLTLGTSTATTQPLTWSAPGSGGTPTDYLIEYKAASSGTWLVFADGVSTALSGTVTGLTNSTSYNYRVSASNGAGTGTASATGTGSTLAPPGQVTGITAGSATTTTQPLTWTAPATGGAVADYIVEFKLHSSSTWATFVDGVSTAVSATVTGLVANTSYDFRVSATNGAGTGTVSSTLTASTSSGGGKITFTDTFTGTNGAAPNARWTPDQSGWTIQGNQLDYAGAGYSLIKADCTAGDNTVSVDCNFINTSTYGGIVIRYIDDNNLTNVVVRGDNSEILRITETVAGVSTTIANDSAARLTSLGGANLSVATVGTAITVTVTGGGNPGSFSGTLTSANASATKIALAMNTLKTGNTFDNCVLA